MNIFKGKGDYIRECRENIGMNIVDLAMKIGVPEKHLNEIERNERALTFGLIQQLYKYLNLDPLIIGAQLSSTQFNMLLGTESIKLTDGIGDRIKAMREENGVTQKDFANLMGTNQRTISHWENGRNDPNIDNIANMLLQFRADPYWLLIGDHEITKDLKAHEKDYSKDSSKLEESIGTKNILHAEICDLLDNASDKFLINLKNKLLELKHINESY